jgi:hypothetical protein
MTPIEGSRAHKCIPTCLESTDKAVLNPVVLSDNPTLVTIMFYVILEIPRTIFLKKSCALFSLAYVTFVILI